MTSFQTEMSCVCVFGKVAMGAVGLARRAMDEATKYALERNAFGKPIFQVYTICVSNTHEESMCVMNRVLMIEACVMTTPDCLWFCTNVNRTLCLYYIQLQKKRQEIGRGSVSSVCGEKVQKHFAVY